MTTKKTCMPCSFPKDAKNCLGLIVDVDIKLPVYIYMDFGSNLFELKCLINTDRCPQSWYVMPRMRWCRQ